MTSLWKQEKSASHLMRSVSVYSVVRTLQKKSGSGHWKAQRRTQLNEKIAKPHTLSMGTCV